MWKSLLVAILATELIKTCSNRVAISKKKNCNPVIVRLYKNLQHSYSEVVNVQPHCSWVANWFNIFYLSRAHTHCTPWYLSLPSLSLSLSFFSCLCLSLPTPCFILPFLYLSQSLSNRRGRCGFVRIGMVEGLWWTLALGCGIEESMVGLS